MNVEYMTLREFRKLAKRVCEFTNTNNIQCNHKLGEKYCKAISCPCIIDLQGAEDGILFTCKKCGKKLHHTSTCGYHGMPYCNTCNGCEYCNTPTP